MKLIKLHCSFCRKELTRTNGRINEAKKFGWKPYCSLTCEGKLLSKRVIFLCARSGCNKKFFRARHEMRSVALYCSRRCAVIVNNTKSPKRKAIVRQCLSCNKTFKSNSTYCSVPCRSKGQIISGEKICEQIKDFHHANGRIPVKREFLHYSAARDRFGNWNNAVRAAGFKPNPILFAEKHIANDGHQCDSFAEKIIDDWLTSKRLYHERSVPYPEEKRLTADFVVGSRWIEFFGLAGELKAYDALVKKKRQLARKRHLSFVALYPKDLFPTNHLSKILKV